MPWVRPAARMTLSRSKEWTMRWTRMINKNKVNSEVAKIWQISSKTTWTRWWAVSSSSPTTITYKANYSWQLCKVSQVKETNRCNHRSKLWAKITSSPTTSTLWATMVACISNKTIICNSIQVAISNRISHLGLSLETRVNRIKIAETMIIWVK